MRNPGTFLAAAAAAILLGCDSGGDPAEGAPTEKPSADPWAIPLDYENGHPLSAPSADPAVLMLESEVIRLVNAHRVSQGLNALVDSSGIRDVARAHARHMIVHRFVGHVNPEGLGAGDRLTQAGLLWTHSGENVAAGYATPQETFDAWMASPGHKEVIEGPLWTHTGAGYAVDFAPTESFPYVHYWAQNFVRP